MAAPILHPGDPIPRAGEEAMMRPRPHTHHDIHVGDQLVGPRVQLGAYPRRLVGLGDNDHAAGLRQGRLQGGIVQGPQGAHVDALDGYPLLFRQGLRGL